MLGAAIDSIALDDLLAQLRYPRKWGLRRVEVLSPDGPRSFHSSVTVTHLVPGADRPDANTRRQVLLPVGIYSKSRLPDLEVTDGRGRRISTIGSQLRSMYLASALLSEALEHVGSVPVLGRPQSFHVVDHEKLLRELATNSELNDLLTKILDLIAGVIQGAPEDAQRLLDELRSLIADRWPQLGSAAQLLTEVAKLTEATPLIVCLRARPGEVVTLSISHRLGLEFDASELRFDPHEDEDRWLANLYMRSSLGIAIRFAMNPHNIRYMSPSASHYQSYYMLFPGVEGLDVVRCYWDHRLESAYPSAETPPVRHLFSQPIAWPGHALACHIRSGLPSQNGNQTLEVQLSRDGPVRLAWLLVTLIALYFLARATDIVDDVNGQALVGSLGAVPGLLVGVLSQTQASFTASISRWLSRAMLFMALVSVSSLLENRVNISWLEVGHLQWPLSAGLAVCMAVILTHVAWLPRNQDPRSPSLTRADIYPEKRRQTILAICSLHGAVIAGIATILITHFLV